MHEFEITRCKVISIASVSNREVIDYGVRMVGAPLEWSETMGEGVKVGIIDTGVDSDHIELKNRIKDCADFTGGSSDNYEDENGHGTHIAGIVAAERNGVGIVGVAPKAQLYIAKAFGADGKTTYPAIEKSVRWLEDKKVDVINMSFSSMYTSAKYRSLIWEAHSRGISIVCAAGNEGELGDNTIGYPADFPETVAVSAVDINKNIADFSSRGKAAEICAAGIDIYSTYLNGGYATLSGTSMACPIITGAVALLQAKGYLRYGRRLTPEEIRLLLNIYTEKLGSIGRDRSYGYGIFSFGRIASEDYIYSNINYNLR
ncbi:MAG: S8 family peptidase [Clostridia bacterium]|nr:S8 family peptidase [Clostridia bacterium]